MAVQFRPNTVVTDEELAYLNAHNAPLRFERSLDGDLIVTPPTGGATGLRNAELVRQIGDWNLMHGHGAVLESSTGLSLGQLNGTPDAGWLSADRFRTIPEEDREKFLTVAPELVFELRSPSDTVSAITKRAKEWVTAGVRLAVVLDPQKRTATPYDKDGSSSLVSVTGEPADAKLRIEKALLPGADSDLILDLAAVFDAAGLGRRPS
jgi:Uma2 family endonuclease